MRIYTFAFFFVIVIYDLICSAATTANNNTFQRKTRIIGGNPDTAQNVPYLVSIRIKSIDEMEYGAGHICSGTLIALNLVVTKYLCLRQNPQTHTETDFKASDFIIVLGTPFRFTLDSNAQTRSVKYVMHSCEHDIPSKIAALRMNADAHETLYVRPVQLCRVEIPKDIDCRVSGWGTIKDPGKVWPDQQRTGLVRTISYADCLRDTSIIYQETQFCAGYMEGGIDACIGDAGSPLVCRKMLTGICVTGGCGVARHPATYIKISMILPYLDAVLNGENRNECDRAVTTFVSIEYLQIYFITLAFIFAMR